MFKFTGRLLTFGLALILTSVSPLAAEPLKTFVILESKTDMPSIGMEGDSPLLAAFMAQTEKAIVSEEGGEEFLAEMRDQEKELGAVIRDELSARNLTEIPAAQKADADVAITVIPVWSMEGEEKTINHWMFDYRTIDGQVERLPFEDEDQLVTLINSRLLSR